MNKHATTLVILLFVLIGNGLSQSNEKKIKQTISNFFDGMYKADSNLINSVVAPNMSLQTVNETTSGKPISQLSKSDFLKMVTKPRKVKLIERITAWDIEINGNMANAWCTYTFYVDTTFSHWGIDNICLYSDMGNWKILSIVDTRKDPKSYTSASERKTQNDNSINSLMDNWHKAAAVGDEKIFFGSMDSSAIYLGTDKTEHWTKKEFELWSKKYFDQNKGWDFKKINRNIYYSHDMKYAWFDELLDTWMGVCRGSGVLHLVNGEYQLMHYNLAVTVPNEKMKKFVKLNK
jgi:hypothetical protein